ncbi:ribonuclease HII [Deltaproteobacteria bacterium TL4]
MKKCKPDLPSLEFENQALHLGFRWIAGLDEAGRGPLAGPVVVAAVILGPQWNQKHPLNDSKKLSELVRERLFDVIRKEACAYRIVAVSHLKIDELNILQATLGGMARAIREISVQPDYVLVDGNQFPPTSCAGQAIVRGDSRSMSIAAASILAKVSRDRIMKAYARLYPQWGFEQHKGYPTLSHRKAVAQYGTTPWHRRSFKVHPISEQLHLW